MRQLSYAATATWVVVILMIGCAEQGVKSPSEMSPEEIGIWANRNYEEQYKAYLQDFEFGHDHTDMKEMLKKKRKILVEVYPLLMTYNEILLEEQVPGPAMTNELVRLIYRLTGIY